MTSRSTKSVIHRDVKSPFWFDSTPKVEFYFVFGLESDSEPTC
ncbi:955_t:CDS:2 [Cetraspora pellucida]|uniref:955_t:CDS:1 n=1 Tax=Cetraspora pellucida TaxID=1433469 RepID=A0A9N9AHF0_9GLOM|nr:955_t:CDS:2 [Cetraspora pellucida]